MSPSSPGIPEAVQLTSEGELLFHHTESAFEALSRGENELKRIKDFNIGHLRIGVSNTLCKYILLPYLKASSKSILT